MNNITFAIHQPNYIPWLGYFYKIAKSEKFVFLDDVQYPRGQSYSNRNRIKTPNGPTYLTIPISIPSGNKGKVSYKEVKFANNRWKRKHLKTLEFNYKRADYYDEVYPFVENIIQKDLSFAELNMQLIKEICKYLNIATPTYKLSNLLNDYGSKTRLIIDIAKELEANTYLSGTGGGKEYNDRELLSKNNIKLIYSDFEHPQYKQLWGDFTPNLSILDLLFNCGAESKKILVESKRV
ncbi:MAG: WbqC family protein [Candidatus Cloacimonetes bacterium]|nr:WbqC family protein [Candidatus Cloacimonadota bacterium]MBS3768292.1 WbqC family protein [Candidatus Cloacimonadota bacterium]